MVAGVTGRYPEGRCFSLRTKEMVAPTREGILKTISEHRDELQRLGVRRLGMFGSAVRDDLSESSDLDFLVEFDAKSFDRYMELKFLLEDLFGRSVDLVLSDALKPRLKDQILKDVVHAEGF